VAADPSWEHVHNLTLRGDELLIGTHEGLWSQLPGTPATLLSDDPFDVMGLALATDGTLYASGHPGPGQDDPADLGLLASTDQGRTWQSVSLAGQVDFHRLRVTDQTVQGLSAHDGQLLRSPDSGATWTSLGAPPLFDFALDPTDAERLVGTTQDGPVHSSDGGRTLTPIAGAPLLALLAWTGDTLYGIAADATVHTATDSGTTWSPTGGQLQGTPTALAADGQTVVALAGDTIWHSTDGGRTFQPRLTGLPDH
jgi:photosystem II stability/assembly factor-like uncharacterized protein